MTSVVMGVLVWSEYTETGIKQEDVMIIKERRKAGKGKSERSRTSQKKRSDNRSERERG